MKAKKSYGQHFLTSEKIAEKIADSIQLSTEWKYLLEVGPGKGMLTKYLMQRTDCGRKIGTQLNFRAYWIFNKDKRLKFDRPT